MSQPGARRHDVEIKEQFTAQVERFVRSPHVNAEEPIARFVAIARLRASERVLDVGCGPGLLAKAFAPRASVFVGIDLTAAMVAKACEVARGAGLANARFAVGDARGLPFPDGVFDLVLTRLVLHHMAEPERAIAEMARVARPGGRVAVFDMTTSEIEEEARYHDEVERLRDPSHASALPLSRLARTLGQAGLQVAALDAMDFAIDAEDWIARAEQTREQADEARRRIAAAIGGRRFGGKRAWRDASGKLWFTVRWVMVVAEKPTE